MKPDEAEERSNSTEGTVPGDADLVQRARARDTEAFRMLVERHRDRAYTLAVRMLRSPVDAEEVVQDAFVRAWTALPQFRGESSFGTWLHRIVVRRSLDRATILARRRAREVDIEAASHVSAPANSASDARAVRLERLIASLGEAQRAAVTLFYGEGRSVEQVATLLGMPVGTVKTHLRRARAALRAAWVREQRAEADEAAPVAQGRGGE